MSRGRSSGRFTAADLEATGYIQGPDGVWRKRTDPAVDRLEAGKHAKQTRALERKAQAPRRRKAGGKTGDRCKRPAEIIVAMTAHLPTYMDSDNLAAALKPVRDELAEWIGIDDGDHRIAWECDQVITRGNPGVCVVVRTVK